MRQTRLDLDRRSIACNNAARQRRRDMKNLRVVILGGLLTGSLVIAGTPAMADPPGKHKGWETHPGLHKGWEKNHHGSVKGHDDDDRYEDHYRHDAYYGRPHYRDHYYRSTEV